MTGTAIIKIVTFSIELFFLSSMGFCPTCYVNGAEVFQSFIQVKLKYPSITVSEGKKKRKSNGLLNPFTATLAVLSFENKTVHNLKSLCFFFFIIPFSFLISMSKNLLKKKREKDLLHDWKMLCLQVCISILAWKFYRLRQ